MATKQQNLDDLGDRASTVGMRAAVEYLVTRKLHHEAVADAGRLTEILRKHLTGAVETALRDSYAAIDAHVAPQVVDQTFDATFACAGIKAAQEWEAFYGPAAAEERSWQELRRKARVI